ncbi:unnamed protein product [Thelazia callipaeda]|uniref:AMP_N domain-containing protein n=1 Tax=Thelazia callipaeda TaxID=103827 RepID=A0A0N5D127_THECL|nr:unnamed protein product [Thelazia callipaeda]
MIGGTYKSLWKVARFSSARTIRCFGQTITPNEYRQRRISLVSHLRQSVLKDWKKSVLIVLRSAIRRFYAPDVPYPFRQCSYFRYLTGLNEPDCVLIILFEKTQNPVSILYFEGRTERQELWEGPGLNASGIINTAGVDEVKSHNQLIQDLQILTDKACIVSYDNTTLSTINDDIVQVLAGCDTFLPLREHIDTLRWIKSPAEQELMRRTCKIGAESMNAVIARSRGVANENEIVGRLELEVRRRGAASLAYPPVVAAGNRANIIHYLDANKALDQGDAVLVDAGCDYEGYSSDITRVFPICGRFNAPQRAMYDALNDVQARLFEYLRRTEHLRLNEIYVTMLKYLAKNISEVGMFARSLDANELLHETDKICPHHVSHYLGMDVHDTASVARNIILQPGVTFTVEPGRNFFEYFFVFFLGIYIRDDNEKSRKEFRGIGMRIEDDILLGKDGTVEVLTRDAIREPENIEQLMTAE